MVTTRRAWRSLFEPPPDDAQPRAGLPAATPGAGRILRATKTNDVGPIQASGDSLAVPDRVWNGRNGRNGTNGWHPPYPSNSPGSPSSHAGAKRKRPRTTKRPAAIKAEGPGLDSSPSSSSPSSHVVLGQKVEAGEEEEEEETQHPRIDGASTQPEPTPSARGNVSKKGYPTWPAPIGWETTYALLSAQRDWLAAPVDTVGCEATGATSADDFALRQSMPAPDPVSGIEGSAKTAAAVAMDAVPEPEPEPEQVGPEGEQQRQQQQQQEVTVRREFATLIALVLSSQTKDAVTAAAVQALQSTLPGGLTAESVASASIETIQKAICQVGFWRRKAGYVQGVARKLLERDGEMRGRPPHTLEELVSFQGVGPKMAFLFLQSVGIGQGIGVDTHVHRIASRLGWTQPLTKARSMPETTRTQLEAFLPRALWSHINQLLVGLGQTVCTPVSPRCDMCAVAHHQRRQMGRQRGGPLCPSMLPFRQAQSQHRVAIPWRTRDEMLQHRFQKQGEWKDALGPAAIPVEVEVDLFVQQLLCDSDSDSDSTKQPAAAAADGQEVKQDCVSHPLPGPVETTTSPSVHRSTTSPRSQLIKPKKESSLDW